MRLFTRATTWKTNRKYLDDVVQPLLFTSVLRYGIFPRSDDETKDVGFRTTIESQMKKQSTAGQVFGPALF